MNLKDARQFLARPVPVAVAAKAFGCDLALLAPLMKDGLVILGEAFRLARRQAEARLRAVRFARRSAYMKGRRAAERAARAFVHRVHSARALKALRQAVASSCAALSYRLRPVAPRLADLAARAGEAVLEADPAAVLRPARRAGS